MLTTQNESKSYIKFYFINISDIPTTPVRYSTYNVKSHK